MRMAKAPEMTRSAATTARSFSPSHRHIERSVRSTDQRNPEFPATMASSSCDGKRREGATM
jgi:hypothetical protein